MPSDCLAISSTSLCPTGFPDQGTMEEAAAQFAQPPAGQLTVKGDRLTTRTLGEHFWYLLGWGSDVEDEASRQYLKKIHDFCETRILECGDDSSHKSS